MILHEEIKYKCKHCNNNFNSKGSLLNHIKSVHSGIKYHCTHCNYGANQKGSLKRHQNVVHEGIKYRYGRDCVNSDCSKIDQLSADVTVCKMRQTCFQIGKILFNLLIHSLLFENNKERKKITLNSVTLSIL